MLREKMSPYDQEHPNHLHPINPIKSNFRHKLSIIYQSAITIKSLEILWLTSTTEIKIQHSLATQNAAKTATVARLRYRDKAYHISSKNVFGI